MLGVCQAIGDDLGFNPTILRAAFAIPLVWSPLMAVGIYLALGLAVLVSRLVVREPRRAKAPVSAIAENTEAAPQPLHADNEALPTCWPSRPDPPSLKLRRTGKSARSAPKR